MGFAEIAVFAGYYIFGYVLVSSIQYAWVAPVLGWKFADTIVCALLGAPLWPICAPISYVYYRGEIKKDESRSFGTCLAIRPRWVVSPVDPLGFVRK